MVILILAVLLAFATPAAGTDLFATNNGLTTGACLTTGTACTVQRAITAAVCGDTINLLDGTYQGAANMLSPGTVAPGKSCASGTQITVKAVNDGAVTFDGQFARRPVYLSGNDWWILEGFNAKNSNSNVVQLTSGSDNNIVRRVVAWDSTIDTNTHVFIASYSSGNLFEDIAGFGAARKILQIGIGTPTGTTPNTARRFWGRWEGSIRFGPKQTMSVLYDLRGGVCENCIATWSAESMPETYTLQGSAGSYTNFTVEQPHVLIDTDDGNDRGACPASRIYGSLAYVRTGDRLPTIQQGLVTGGNASCMHIRHTLTVMSPSNTNFNDIKGFSLNHLFPTNATPDFTQTDTSAYNITSIRGTSGDTFHADWDRGSGATAGSHGTSLAAVADPWTNTGAGATLCYRWTPGGTSASTTPLWPWPMDARIEAATAAAGAYAGPCPTCTGGRSTRTPTNVTDDVEDLLGTIPAACRSDAPVSPFAVFSGFPSTSELDAFSDSGMGGWSTLTGNGWTESGGVASPTSGFSTVTWDTSFNANQEAACNDISTLPTEGGNAFHIKFLVQSSATQYRAYVSRVTGSSNDTVTLDKLVNSVTTTLVSAVNLGVDMTASDRLGVRVQDNTISVGYYASSWGEWRKVAETTDSGLPSSSKIGMGASAGACSSFYGGNVGGGGGGGPTGASSRPAAPSRPAVPSRPVAPSRPAAP